MSRKKISIEQILQNGKTHITKEEIDKRKEDEETLKKLAKDKIKPPTWLGKMGKKFFKDIVVELQAIEILANIDTYNLAILSDALDKYVEATQRLHSDDLLVEITNKSGHTSTQKNPLITIQIQYSEIIRKLSNEFGLTPAARLKIIQQNAPEISEEEKDFNEDFGDV